MDILHIIDTLSMGGAENVLVGLASGQKLYGHNVTVMPLVCPSVTPVRKKMEDAGITVIPFCEKGSVYNPLLIIRISRVIKRYSIVHVHLFPALYWTAFAKMISFSKIPLVFTEHSTNNKRRRSWLLHYIDYFVYSQEYKMVIACAERVHETFRRSFPKINHVCYINNGVNTREYRDAVAYSKNKLLGINEDSFLITMVARFMPMKRQDTVVEALVKLPNNTHVVFVGGEKKDEGLLRVKDYAAKIGVSERVHFLYIRNDIPRILKTSDVIVLASDYEGLSLSSIEGMSSGKPFIASDVDGLREVVGGAGLLFKNKDSDSLARLIIELASNVEFYNTISEKCLLRADRFDINTMVDSYMNVYDLVLR